MPNLGGEILDAWSVSCPGGPAGQTWYANMYRCGDPCPPADFSVMSAEGMRLWLASGRAYDAGQIADAHELAREAAAAWPASERIQYWLGMTALDQRDLRTALDAFGRAAEMDPEDVANLYHLAGAQHGAGLTALFVDTLARGLEIAPPDHPIRPGLVCMAAMERWEHGDREAAMPLAEEACAAGFEPCCDLGAE
jgi:tetratricopeptide (TPR) repeat protein